jgi:hypothetical protein
VVAGYELLSLIDAKVLEGVDAEIGENFERVGALDVQIRHVMRLIEQCAGLAPGPLFIPPVGELMLDHREGIGPYLGIAQHLDRASGGLYRVLQASLTHGLS